MDLSGEVEGRAVVVGLVEFSHWIGMPLETVLLAIERGTFGPGLLHTERGYAIDLVEFSRSMPRRRASRRGKPKK